MPTRSIFQPFFIQTSIHDSGIPHDPHRKFSRTTMQSPISPNQKGRRSIQVHFLFGSFILFGIAFVIGPMPYRSPDRSIASLKQHVCSVPTKRNARALRGGIKTSGLVGKEPLPLSLSHARKVWSAGAGICQALAVIGGCDVSHFRMDSTMCGTPPSFFLFFLSCQMNACSLGYRTEEVIHQK